MESEIDLLLYPNPFDEILNISHEYKYDYLKIFDINGKLVLQTSKESIDTKFLKDGIYILKLFNSQSSSQFKIIKVKK
jgi:hypothetical protein